MIVHFLVKWLLLYHAVVEVIILRNFAEYGKRPREEQKGSNYRETAWALNEVVFIHKESSQDTAIVKIVRFFFCYAFTNSSHRLLAIIFYWSTESTWDMGTNYCGVVLCDADHSL